MNLTVWSGLCGIARPEVVKSALPVCVVHLMPPVGVASLNLTVGGVGLVEADFLKLETCCSPTVHGTARPVGTVGTSWCGGHGPTRLYGGSGPTSRCLVLAPPVSVVDLTSLISH